MSDCAVRSDRNPEARLTTEEDTSSDRHLPALEYRSSIFLVGSSDAKLRGARATGYSKRHRTRALILEAAVAEAGERGLHGSLLLAAELPRAAMGQLMVDFSARLAEVDEQHYIAGGSVRPMDDDETVAQAHVLLGTRRFPEDSVVKVGREESVLDAFPRPVRHGLAAGLRSEAS